MCVSTHTAGNLPESAYHIISRVHRVQQLTPPQIVAALCTPCSWHAQRVTTAQGTQQTAQQPVQEVRQQQCVQATHTCSTPQTSAESVHNAAPMLGPWPAPCTHCAGVRLKASTAGGTCPRHPACEGPCPGQAASQPHVAGLTDAMHASTLHTNTASVCGGRPFWWEGAGLARKRESEVGHSVEKVISTDRAATQRDPQGSADMPGQPMRECNCSFKNQPQRASDRPTKMMMVSPPLK